MAATKTKSVHTPGASAGNEYRGKRTRTGNGFRFDRALFKSHPEFAGEVKAHVIAPGRMLVSVAEPVNNRRDPVMQSFLAFLANDIATVPKSIKPMSTELAWRIDNLVEEAERDARRKRALQLRGVLKREEAAKLQKTTTALRASHGPRPSA
jgi:hypothetical protein